MALGTRRHSLLTDVDVGALVRWTVADETSRLALALLAADKYRLAHQTDDGSYWILTDTSGPTWTQLGNVSNNTAAALAPTVNDDELAGYAIGDGWVNTTNDSYYVLVDATAGAAVWALLGAVSVTWGDISGTLSDQADLQVALDGKSNVGHTHAHNTLTGLDADDHTQYLLVTGLRDSHGLSFAAQSSSTLDVYLDDGTNFDAGTLVFGRDGGDIQEVNFPDTIAVGEVGDEQGGINLGGVGVGAQVKVNDYQDRAKYQLILHRHSTTDPASQIFARSNSTGIAHTPVTNGQVLGQIDFVGWSTGNHYDIAAAIEGAKDATGGGAHTVGQLRFLTSREGDEQPTLALTLDRLQNATFAGDIALAGTVDGRDVDADGTAQDSHIADGTIHFTEASIDKYTQAQVDALLAALEHHDLNGLGDDDHTQYHTDARGDLRYPRRLDGAGAPGVSTGNGYALGTVYADTTNDLAYILVDATTDANVWSSGVTDHGALGGLGDDDHTQYYLGAGTRAADAFFLAERADHVNAAASGFGEMWLKTGTPGALWFTNELAEDVLLTAGTKGQPSYKASTSTASTDPGSGYFRFNNTDYNLATELYINTADRHGHGIHAILTECLANNSQILVINEHEPFKRCRFWVTGWTDNTGWLTISVDSTKDSASSSWANLTANKTYSISIFPGVYSHQNDATLHFTEASIDHGNIAGLGDDDHPHYHTDARGDARYSLLGHSHTESDISDLGSYVTTDGATAQDAWLLAERADHVNVPATGFSEVWLNSAINPPRLMFTNESGTDGTVVVYRSGAPGNNAILTGYGTEGTVDGSTLFSWNSSTGQLSNAANAGSSLRLKEGTTIGATPTALFGSIYVKDDSPNRLHYVDGDLGDNTLAYLAELNDGTVDHGNTTGLGDDDHTQYVLADGTRAQDAVFFTDRADHVNTPAAGTAELWVDSDAGGTLQAPVFTDDFAIDWHLARTTAGVDGGILVHEATGRYETASADFAYVSGELRLWGATPALSVEERATAPANLVGAGKLWANSAFFGRPWWTEDGSADRAIVCGPNSIVASVTDNAIVTWDSTSGGVVQDSTVRVDDSGNLILDDASSFIQLDAARLGTSPPAASSGNVRLWAMADNTSGSNGTQSLWATNDNSYDQRLGQQCINISFEVSPGLSGYWFGWSVGGPYNDTIWSEQWGTGATPTLSTFYDHPPLAVLPGDTRVERVVGWYTSESTTQTWEMELMYLTFADQDAYGAIVRDTICDGSSEGSVIVTANTKVSVVDHVVVDNTCTPTDTAHAGGFYLCFRETSATKVGADLKGSVSIYYSTLTPDGWYNSTI